MQNAEGDADRGDHNKSEEGVIPLVIACLSTAEFLEAIEETLYYIPPFIRLFIKRPRLLCVHFRRDRIAGGLVVQISSNPLLCHRLYRQEYHSPSGLEATSAEELPPCNRQHFRQTAKKPQAAGLFQRWHEFSCSDLRVFCRCCLMSDFCSLSYSTTCLHGCFDRR